MKPPADALLASLQPAVQERLVVFAELLQRWNPRINLVSRRDIDGLWPRHMEWPWSPSC